MVRDELGTTAPPRNAQLPSTGGGSLLAAGAATALAAAVALRARRAGAAPQA